MAATTVLVENEEIDEAYRGLSGRYKGRKEDYFALLYLTKRFQIPVDEAAKHVSFGANECAIDAFYLDRTAKNLYLFQFKCSDDHLLFREPLERMALIGIDRIFGYLPRYEGDGQLTSRLRASMAENQGAVDRVVVQLVFNGDPVRAEQSRVLDLLREYLESKKYIVDGYFGRQVDIIFQVISNEKTLGHQFRRRQSLAYSISFDSSLNVRNRGNELIFAFVPLGTLHQMYGDLGDRFFEKNIRCGVNDGRLTRKEIKKSLKRMLAGEEPIEHFAFYHNGVTLTAQKLELGPHSLNMTEPRLLNGVQTVKTVKEFADSNRKRAGKIRKMLDGVLVMARIVRSDEEEFLKRVTISNNRQNPIMPWNLRANDLVQLHLEELFKDRLGVYYERRENSLEDLADEDLEEMNISCRKAVRIRKLAQTLLALHGEVDRISQMKEVFESERWYADTFRERYLGVDPRRLVLIYKVHYRIAAIVKGIRDLGVEKYDYVGKLRNLVWCLAIQGMLNDDRFDSYVQAYGSSLNIEANFNLLLKNLASMKLRFILRDTFNEKRYREYLDQAKYSFLKTRSAYDDCMGVARKQFGWEKRDL